MVGITGQNFYIEHIPNDPVVHTITTYLYSLGLPSAIDYSTSVSSSTPWLTITSGASGQLTSPALGGELVTLKRLRCDAARRHSVRTHHRQCRSFP